MKSKKRETSSLGGRRTEVMTGDEVVRSREKKGKSRAEDPKRT